MKYAILIESGPRNYSAFAPDLPGCVAVGYTLDEVKENMRSAIASHIENLRSHGDPVPPPTLDISYAEIA
ncbi:MAG: type II toxin-antitoxin system HicB family antitoxin [Candidatus Eremiobacteraeota bacterium]|nr:type II toxin-antitoxin system HicB family antitoxin [Candidatus Eremiobacteraeota bacterium]